MYSVESLTFEMMQYFFAKFRRKQRPHKVLISLKLIEIGPRNLTDNATIKIPLMPAIALNCFTLLYFFGSLCFVYVYRI